jgi:hypothetical protein
MFFDPIGQDTFVIDRVSGSGRPLRRVLLLRQDSLMICKANSVVTRMINLAAVTHLIFCSKDGIRAGLVLLRIHGEHDVLFSHPPDRQNVVRVAALFVEQMTKLRGLCAGGAPLNVIERNDEPMLRDAANLVKAPSYVKPRGFAIDGQVLVPLLFDSFDVPADTGIISEELDLFVDPTFITLLMRAMDQYQLSSRQPPLVSIEVPTPFKNFEVGAKFLSGFFRAYERELPLVINMHSHLPTITSFRASKRFWAYVQRLLQVSRSPATHLGALSVNHVEVYVVGQEQHPIVATLKDWNDVMLQWEREVRDPQLTRGIAFSSEAEMFWKTFVAELETAKLA